MFHYSVASVGVYFLMFKFEVFIAVWINVKFLWVIAPSCVLVCGYLNLEYKGYSVLRNVATDLPYLKCVSLPRTQQILMLIS